MDLATSPCHWDHNLIPWVQEIATSFKRLKVVHFQSLVVHDSDLELLARSRGEKLRILEIDSHLGFSTDGLLYVGKYCTDLRILSLENSSINENDGEWAGLTKFDVKDLVGFFIYVAKLEDFGGGRFGDNNPISHIGINDDHFGIDPFELDPFGVEAFYFEVNNPIGAEGDKYKDFRFSPKLEYLALNHTGRKEIILPFAHLITQLDIQFVYDRNHLHQLSLIDNCPNLEVLYTAIISNDGLKHLSQYYKNLRKLYVRNTTGLLTERGLFSLALGCLELECLHINLDYITFEAMVHIGINMKNLSDLSMILRNKGVSMRDSVLDNGVRSLLIGCNKLERLSICFQELEGLSNIGLSYIGRFGCNLRYLSLGYAGETDAGFVELSFGCPKLQNLVINDCHFSKEAFDLFRCNVPSLSYFQFQGMPRHCRHLLEEAQPNFKQIF